MTAAYSTHALACTTHGTVFSHREDEVLTATGIEAASRGEQWTQEGLIGADARDEKGGEERTHPVADAPDHCYESLAGERD